MVDKALILRKLAELDEYLGQVKEYVNINVEQFLADWKTQRIIERTLQMIVETCVDIAGHIISDRGYRTPISYADTFRVLYESNILAKEEFGKLEKMAKFRNIIVHLYDRVDAEIVIGILKRDLEDLSTYKDVIIKMLKEDETTPNS